MTTSEDAVLSPQALRARIRAKPREFGSIVGSAMAV